MDTIRQDHRGRVWFFAAAGALVVGLAVPGLFRVPASLAAPADPALPTTLEIMPRDATVHEQAGVYDPTSLFLPAQGNAKSNALPGAAAREPTGDNFHYDAQFQFPVAAARVAFPIRASVPNKPVDALSLWAQEAPFLGMGETDLAVASLPRRDALVEIVTAGNGRQVLTQVLQDARPPGGGDWQPMEFLVTVEPAGLVGLPIPVPGSNVAEVANYFQNYLAKKLRVGERLAPGSYRIKVGP
jgi:hypothetical protein